MTENSYNVEIYNKTGHFKPDPRTFAGEISNYDFEGYNSLAQIAGNIASSWIFDKYCCNVGKLNKFNVRKENN